VKLTSYNAVPEQTDHNPSVTASGAFSNPEVVAARSVDLKGTLPFGTVVALTRKGGDTENCRFGAVEHLIGYRVIADSMNSRMRNKIDVLLNASDTVLVHGVATNPSLALGLCNEVEVRVVGKIDIKDMPQTQEELRKLVEGDSFALAR
jgi:3D (Asp-Asp-Asp) domain-containing protein